MVQVTIIMKQLEGDRNFVAPALRSAPVFGGIAGIVAGEAPDTGDTSHMPTLSHSTREAGEQRDMYRRTLAASWNCQIGEMPADECIEDIFAGGMGIRGFPTPFKPKRVGSTDNARPEDESVSGPEDIMGSDDDTRRDRVGLEMASGVIKSDRKASHGSSDRKGHARGKNSLNLRRDLLETGLNGRDDSSDPMAFHRMTKNELNEFEAREDLRSWRLPLSG
jgi:hypothetical protein